MGVVIQKKFFYQLLFVLCVGAPYINSYEIAFLVWTISALVTFRISYSDELLKQVGCYVLIIGIAFIMTFYHDYKGYFIIRDIAYISKPIIGLLVGYQLCRFGFKDAFKTIVYTGLFIAIIHLLLIVNAVVFLNARTVNMIRVKCGYFSDFEVYVIIVLIFQEKFGLYFSRQKRLLLLAIIGLSALMYMSRTNFIQFIILAIAMKGYLKWNRSSVIVVSMVALFTLVGYSAILYLEPKRNGPGIEALLYKIKVAPIEPFKTKIDRGNWKDFNDNYRSYENINTVKQVTRDDTKTLLFGKGLGSRVDLKQKIHLGDMFLTKVSILHNGFMTVLLKSGLAGLVLLLVSILLLFRSKPSNLPIVKNINMLLVGSGFFMIVSCWVFMGFYFTADTKSLLFGFLFCYKAMAENQAHLARSHD